MKNDPLGINPPAIVKQAATFSLRQLAKRIRPKLRREADNCMVIGEDMERIFGMVAGRARQDFLKKEFGISERQAWKYLRAWRGRDRIREKPSEQETDSDTLSVSLAEAMRLLDEDDAPKEVAPTGDVPFATNGHAPKAAEKVPNPAQEREPGDMTPEEEEQERADAEIDAKIKAALCLRCSRIGQPSCELCRGKAARIREGETVRPGVRTTPNDPRDHKPKNGQLIVNWQALGSRAEALVKEISGTLSRIEADVLPEASEMWTLMQQSLKKFTAICETKKQKAPKNTWPLFPEEKK